jgi:hypothetical protein
MEMVEKPQSPHFGDGETDCFKMVEQLALANHLLGDR